MPEILEKPTEENTTVTSADVDKILEEDGLINKSTILAPSVSEVAANPNNFETWIISKGCATRLVILHARKSTHEITGEPEIKPGLTVEFGGSRYMLNKKHKYYMVIRRVLQSKDDYKMQRMVCLEELSPEDRRKAQMGLLGVNPNSAFAKAGIKTEKQKRAVVDLLAIYEKDTLAEKNSQIQKLKDDLEELKLKEKARAKEKV